MHDEQAPGWYGVALIAAACVGLITAIQWVLPILPLLQQELGISDAQVGLVTLFFVLPTAVLALHFGMLGDRWPPRSVLAWSLVVYGACGVAHLAVTTFEQLLVMRLIQGMAFAAAMPLTLVLIVGVYRDAGQLRAIALRQTAITLGELLLPLVAGALAILSWRAPYVAQGLLIPIGIAIGAHFGPEVGAGTGGSGVISLTRTVMRRAGSVAVMLVAFARFFFKFTLIAYVPVLLVTYLDGSVQEATLVVAVGATATALSANRSPRLLKAVQPSAMLISGLALIAAGMAAIALLETWWLALAAIVVYGIGDGFLVVLQDAYVARIWPTGEQVGAAAVSQLARNLGKVLSPVVFTGLLLVVSMDAAFAIFAAFAAIGAVLARTTARLDPAFARGARAEPGGEAPKVATDSVGMV